jgi:hypothetical protein
MRYRDFVVSFITGPLMLTPDGECMIIRNPATSFLLAAVLLGPSLASTRAVQADTAATQPAYALNNPVGQDLRAGPIQMKFAGGELRYLRIGDKEILRRIYFGVREAKFSATDMPRLSDVHIDAAADHFTVHFSAVGSGKTVSFHWNGEISGTADGKIIYHAGGAAPSDGTSARIGLCVLLSSDLAGHSFSVTGDATTTGTFPEFVTPALVADNFHSLQYTTGGHLVAFTIPESPFYMEDQRTYGDTSFKAYNPLPFAYPGIEKGKLLGQTLTLTVKDLPAAATTPSTVPASQPADGAIHVRIGSPIPGARICALSSSDQFEAAVPFGVVNQHRDQYAKETAVTWNWTTGTHLPDNDTSMENTPAIIDQAKTVRSFAPRALLRVGPISIDGKWPLSMHPPIVTAAWTASAIHALSEADVDEAAFLNPTPEAQQVISRFKEVTGKPLVKVNVSRPRDVEAFAVNDIGTTTLWLINRSDRLLGIQIDDLPPGVIPKLSMPIAGSPLPPLNNGSMELLPYAVCRIVIPQ